MKAEAEARLSDARDAANKVVVEMRKYILRRGGFEGLEEDEMAI